MFDVGFSEMLVIGVVALLVIGPEKLPGVARTVGALIGRMQRYVNDVKADINREIELDELKKIQTTVQDAAKSIETSMNDTMSTFQTQADELNKIASGDIAGLTETKALDDSATGVAAAAAGEAPALTASGAAQAEAGAMFAAAESAPGPAALAESVSTPSAQNGSQSGSQASLPLEPAATNASGEPAGAESAGAQGHTPTSTAGSAAPAASSTAKPAGVAA